MEAAQPDSRSNGKRRGGRSTKISFGVWATFSSPSPPLVHRTQGAIRLRSGWSSSRGVIGIADNIGVRSRGWFPAAKDSLDVVAGNRWAGHRIRRSGFSASAGRRLRHHRCTPARRRDYKSHSRSPAGQMVYLGGITGVGYIGRRPGAVADDGGALGGLEAMFLPHEGVGFWPLISMGAILGGTMRSPFTSIVFAFELTHDANIFLPLLVSSVIAHAFTVLTLRRSILTEKVARRGYHLSREYAVDPLEILFVREVMRTKIVVLPATSTLGEIWQSLRTDHRQEQRLLPVVDTEGLLVGVLTRLDISERMEQDRHAALRCLLGEVARREVVEAYPDEPFRVVVYRMAEKGVTRMPVVDRGTRTFLGLISLNSAESTHATLGGRTPTRTDAEI
jgi:CBS domain-containing protein